MASPLAHSVVTVLTELSWLPRYCVLHNIFFPPCHRRETSKEGAKHWQVSFTVKICYIFTPRKMNEIFHFIPSKNSGHKHTREPSWLQYLRYVTCHYSECEFSLHILKSDGKYFDGTVSWISPVGHLGFICSGRKT